MYVSQSKNMSINYPDQIVSSVTTFHGLYCKDLNQDLVHDSNSLKSNFIVEDTKN